MTVQPNVPSLEPATLDLSELLGQLAEIRNAENSARAAQLEASRRLQAAEAQLKRSAEKLAEMFMTHYPRMLVEELTTALVNKLGLE